MNEMNLTITEQKVQPLSEVHGSVIWNLQSLPEDIDIRLFWYTRGIGTEDMQIVDRQHIEPRQQGEYRFSFQIPEGPYSFSGKLISLIWAVECVANPSDVCARQEITVSPTLEEIRLVNHDGETKR